jgi:glycosyltransferase involved in cell wall biosynthesis
MPRVSVIMPTYAHAHFIRRAIASLSAQSFTNWELVIVDDAAPDDTADIIAPMLADPRFVYLRHPVNLGLGAALNIGLAGARGEYITYLPSDDVMYADHLATLVASLDSAPDAKLAYSGVRLHYNCFAEGQIPVTGCN